MSLTATNWLELIEQLPADAGIRLHNIAWDDYEEMLVFLCRRHSGN